MSEEWEFTFSPSELLVIINVVSSRRTCKRMLNRTLLSPQLPLPNKISTTSPAGENWRSSPLGIVQLRVVTNRESRIRPSFFALSRPRVFIFPLARSFASRAMYKDKRRGAARSLRVHFSKTTLIFSPKTWGNPTGLFLPHPNWGQEKEKKMAGRRLMKIEITICKYQQLLSVPKARAGFLRVLCLDFNFFDLSDVWEEVSESR